MTSLWLSVESTGLRDEKNSMRNGNHRFSHSKSFKGIRFPRSSCIPAGHAAALFLLVSFVLGGLGAPLPGYAQQGMKSKRVKASSNEVLEKLVLRFTNEERRRRGLQPLKFSPALRYVARKHSANMCQSGVFQHEDSQFPQGWETFDERLGRVGLASGGENIAYRTLQRDPRLWAREAVKGWMNSTSHRRNILDPRFRFMGVGIRPCKNGLGYATQVFSPAHGGRP